MRRYIKRNSINFSKINPTDPTNSSKDSDKITKNVTKRRYKKNIYEKPRRVKSYTVDQVLNIFIHKNKTINMIIESFADLDSCINKLSIKSNKVKYGIMNSKDYYLIDEQERSFFARGIDEDKLKSGIVAIINGMDIYISDKCYEKTLIFFGKCKNKNFIYGVENVDFSARYKIG